ncbi:MAG: Mut7-C RNAse domain-containing protein [Candidatus Bipolaricaulis sp.]|nr:Mut7-C RNAse domain-containing protein [Candidatus Bipolaricaulis sp.]
MPRIDPWAPQSEASFSFLGGLSDFLAPPERGRPISHVFRGAPSVKDAVEALGVPHVEVDAILVNGASVGFEHPLRDGDQVCVYPFDVPPESGSVLHLLAPLLAAPTFVADVHLRRLARTLRLLGFDTRHGAELTDADIVGIARDEVRVVLTRDRQLLKHRALAHGYWVRSTDPETQAREVVRRFGLVEHARPFTRCCACNDLLRSVEKSAVRDRIPPRAALWIDGYWECLRCQRLYWWGTHSARLQAVVESALGSSQC